MTKVPGIDRSRRFIDQTVEPYLQKQNELEEDRPTHSRRSTRPESQRARKLNLAPFGSDRLALEMRDHLLNESDFRDAVLASNDGELVPYLHMCMASQEYKNRISRGIVQKLFSHKICSLLIPETQYPVSGDRPEIRTVVRNTVLIRDNAQCAVCGRNHELPLQAYSDIRKALGLRGETREERREAQTNHRRAYWHCAKPCMDHVIPARTGAPSSEWNLTVLCRLCNVEKKTYFVVPLVRKALDRLEESLLQS